MSYFINNDDNLNKPSHEEKKKKKGLSHGRADDTRRRDDNVYGSCPDCVKVGGHGPTTTTEVFVSGRTIVDCFLL